MFDIIEEKLKEAWEEQDIPKFNSLLDLKKRYDEGEDTDLNLFFLEENSKRDEKLIKVLEPVVKKIELQKDLDNIKINQRIVEIENFLKSQ